MCFEDLEAGPVETRKGHISPESRSEASPKNGRSLASHQLTQAFERGGVRWCLASWMLASLQIRGRLDSQVGRASRRVRNISIGEMTVALHVRARDPAISGAGVKTADEEEGVTCGTLEVGLMVELGGKDWVDELRLRDEVLAAGSADPVKKGEMRPSRNS